MTFSVDVISSVEVGEGDGPVLVGEAGEEERYYMRSNRLEMDSADIE